MKRSAVIATLSVAAFLLSSTALAGHNNTVSAHTIKVPKYSHTTIKVSKISHPIKVSKVSRPIKVSRLKPPKYRPLMSSKTRK